MIIFQPTNDEMMIKGESLATVSQEVAPPQIRDVVSLGNVREWIVVHIETYYQDLKPLYLVMVTREQPSGSWTAVWMRERSPDLSFYVQVAPDGRVLGSGYRMMGDAPVGRLYNAVPTDHPTRLKKVDQPWVTDLIDTYRPQEAGLFSALHICRCVPCTLPEMAVA